MNVCTRSFFSLSDKTDDDDPSSAMVSSSRREAEVGDSSELKNEHTIQTGMW